MQDSDKAFFGAVNELKRLDLKTFPVSPAPAYSWDELEKQAVPMATRKTTFEVVKLAQIAPLLQNAKVPADAVEAVTQRTPARILSVTYDPSLAATREMLFSSVGFQVSSTSNINHALELCANNEFDLVVIGHSMPMEQTRLLVKGLRLRCDTPLLVLQRPGESLVTGVEYIFDSTESPALLLESVVNILSPNTLVRHV